MKILIKFPTRGRRDIFFDTLNLYYKLAFDIENICFLIECDTDDTEMNTPSVRSRLSKIRNFHYHFSKNKSKVGAVNNHISDYISQYDIILLASDDMIPVIPGYDEIIRTHMKISFPDTDGCLWYFDGYTGDRVCTLPIMGTKYYKRFNYIYQPDYKSLYCDNEYTEVAAGLHKIKYFHLPIIEHHHYSKSLGMKLDYDKTYEISDSFEPTDRETYNYRRSKNYFLF